MNEMMGACLDSITAKAAPSRPVCADCAVRHQGLCDSLADDELIDLHRLGRRRYAVRGEAIACAGDRGDQCATLVSGMLKLSATTADGREQTVGLLYPGDLAGNPYAEVHGFTITALGDAELCVVPRAGFERVLERHAPLERALLRRTLAALEDARARMLVLARQSAEERVVGFLLDMADRVEVSRATPGGPVTFDLPLSRGAIADVLGLTIETVSRQMTRLKGAGLIALPGGRAVTILRRDGLEALIGGA